ncbi:MAG: MFS transporter, partial [Pseudomonadota bacterium]
IKHLGAIRSVIQAAMVFSTALGPWITGVLIDRGIPLPTQFGWMSLYCVVACGSLFWTSRRILARN